MRVVSTPVKNRPSNRRSRARRARSHVFGSRAKAVLTMERAYHLDRDRPGRRDDDVRKRRDRRGPGRYRADMRGPFFYGWNVVGAVSVMAFLSFGLGFY